MLLLKIFTDSLCIKSTLNWHDQSLYGVTAVGNLYANNVPPINQCLSYQCYRSNAMVQYFFFSNHVLSIEVFHVNLG